jgi:hypothetical protein
MVTASVALHGINDCTPGGAFTQGFGYGHILPAGHACNNWHGMWMSRIIAHAKASSAIQRDRRQFAPRSDLDGEASGQIVTVRAWY